MHFWWLVTWLVVHSSEGEGCDKRPGCSPAWNSALSFRHFIRWSTASNVQYHTHKIKMILFASFSTSPLPLSSWFIVSR
jgi:hypothetical protein